MNIEKWTKVKKIFHDALDVDTEARERFVRERCGEDETLFAEVRSLFEAHDENGEFIESAAFASVSDLVDQGALTRIGRTVGAYRIESEIGRGGMGSVYLASRADREFEKKVAIKLIKRGFDTEEIIGRFRYERQILASIDHPFITRLIDGGATEDGLPYLVMDYVRGAPLTRFADANSLGIDDRLRIFLEVCSAVSYAHKNLIVHRDLKPSNILVTADRTPRLLDFGIAKLIAPGDGTRSHTDTAIRAMTPEYASPEQIIGAAVTTSTDIYSLGIILYELLTGHRPFRLKTRDAEAISRFITETSPVKPSSVCRARGFQTSIGNRESAIRTLQGDLDNIVLMAIRKEPERRYSSVDQFAEDIRRYLAGLPVIAQEDTFGYRARKFIRRNKGGVAAGAGIAISLIGGLIAASREARRTSRERDRARREARKAEKINAFLRKMLSSADPRSVGKDVKVIEVLGIAAESIEKDFANQPEIAFDLESTIGLTYLNLGQIESAERFLRSAYRKAESLFPGRSAERARGRANYAKVLQAKGDLESGEPLMKSALAILRSLGGHESEIAEVLNSLGYLIAMRGDTDRALRIHEEELEIRRGLFGENHPEVANTLEKLGSVLSVMDRRDLAEPVMRRSLRILRNVYGEEHPDVALALVNLAGSIHTTKPDEAEQLCRESLAMRRKLFGDDTAEVAWSLYNLAYVLINRKRYEEAEDLLREALSNRGANLPDEHPVVGSAMLSLGRIRLETGSLEAARRFFLDCLALRRKTLPEGHWLLATTRGFLGESLFLSDRRPEGLEMMAEALATLERVLGPNHDQTKQLRSRIARLRSGGAIA